MIVNQEQPMIETDRPPESTAKAAEPADRVEDDLERFKFNTALAAMMEMTN